jgi:porin
MGVRSLAAVAAASLLAALHPVSTLAQAAGGTIPSPVGNAPDAPAAAPKGYDPSAPQELAPADPDAAMNAALEARVARAQAKRRAFLCKNTRDPRKRPFECRNPWYDEVGQDIGRAWSWMSDEATRLGILPSLSYTAQVVTNTSGVTPVASQQVVYAGQVNGSVNLDFRKLVGVPGLSFYVGATWGTGGEFAVGSQGNYFAPASAAAGTGFWLGEMYLQQGLLKGNLTLAAGRLGAGAVFATLPAFGNYLNGAINANPAALGINLPSFPLPPPGSEWGAQAIWYPTGNWQLAAGVYNNNLNSAAGADHGADFKWNEGNRGVLGLAQLSYLLFQGGTEDEGPPGQYSIGGYYDGNYFPVLPNGTTNDTGNWGIYAMFQQAVFQVGGPDSQVGLSAWGAATYTSRNSVNTMPVSFMAGLSYQGLIPGRSTDVLAVGWSFGRVSPAIPSVSGETLLEVNYTYNVASWLSVTPDFQYIWRPGGYYVLGAAVAGVQVVVTL